jgi:hypothetical protein
MVIAASTTMQVPLYWELLDSNIGNSSSEDRIELLRMCIKLLGKDRIGLVIGDREFVGHTWMKYLKDNNLLFVMRLPKHHLIERLDGRRQTVTDLKLTTKKPVLLTHYLVDGVVGHVWVKALPEGDYLLMFGDAKVKYFGQFYRKRWRIETVFQAFKKRGFNLENTYLKMLAKLKKLVTLVSIAYSICVSMGIYEHQKVQKINTKKHGYKAKSFARKGIDSIREVFRQGKELPQYLLSRLLSLLRSILMQSAH